jgi:hypothetical protein
MEALFRVLKGFQLTIPDTARMTTPELKELVSSVKPVNIFIALLLRIVLRCKAFEVPHVCINDNPWIFIRAFLFYHNRVHTHAVSLKRVRKGMVDAAHRFLDFFFGILSSKCAIKLDVARGFSLVVSEYARMFYLWNDEITKEHRKQETELLTQDIINLEEFSTFKKHAAGVYCIHRQLNGPMPAAPLKITQEECIRQLMDITPMPETGFIAAANKWKTFRRAVKDTHIHINRLRNNEDMTIYTSKKLGPDAVFTRIIKGTHNHRIMNDFMALAVMEHLKYDYKAREYLLPLKAPLTVSDLGKQFLPFHNCRIVWHIEHGHHTMALVQTEFAPHIVFTRGNNTCTVRLVQLNQSTMCITAERKNEDTANKAISVGIVELKLCTACGNPAKRKCARCWNETRNCIRYCDRTCQANDSNFHRVFCGYDVRRM